MVGATKSGDAQNEFFAINVLTTYVLFGLSFVRFGHRTAVRLGPVKLIISTVQY